MPPLGVVCSDTLRHHDIAAHGKVIEEIHDDVVDRVDLTDPGQRRAGYRSHDGHIYKAQKDGRHLVDEYARIKPFLLGHHLFVITDRQP